MVDLCNGHDEPLQHDQHEFHLLLVSRQLIEFCKQAEKDANQPQTHYFNASGQLSFNLSDENKQHKKYVGQFDAVYTV